MENLLFLLFASFCLLAPWVYFFRWIYKVKNAPKPPKKKKVEDQGRYGKEFFTVVLFVILFIVMVILGVGGSDLESSGWLRWSKGW